MRLVGYLNVCARCVYCSITTAWHGAGMRAWRAGYVHTLVTTSQLRISRWLKHHKVSQGPKSSICLLAESCMVGAHCTVTCSSLYGTTLCLWTTASGIAGHLVRFGDSASYLWSKTALHETARVNCSPSHFTVSWPLC